ncbi:MAG TPA: hypothetical protein VF950_11765 [Planctomycetota bacterium]
MDEFTSSHRLKLTLPQWAVVAVFGLAVMLSAPRIWPVLEPLEAGKTYRMPYELSNDYAHYARWAARAVESRDTVLIGDSVVWGQYVKPGETLSDHLNALSGTERYANLGLDGAHPAALAGLVEHFGGAVRGKNVILQCNPLWMSSPKHDLREKEEFKFNHAALAPQFSPSIPCYKDDIETRLSRVVDRNLQFRGWTGHLQAAYFDGLSVPSWTTKNPAENPARRVTLKVPPPSDTLLHSPISWVENGGRAVDFPWMALEESFQFTQFLRALDILRSRDNRVVVVVGPFNEHMCKPESLARYATLRDAIAAKLRGMNVPAFVPAALPTETYGDASHPLSKGYEILARQLLDWKP